MTADRLAVVAESLGLMTEADFVLLAGVKQSTADTWRRRGTGPDYVRLGSNFFYPRASLIKFLMDKTHQQTNVARGAL